METDLRTVTPTRTRPEAQLETRFQIEAPAVILVHLVGTNDFTEVFVVVGKELHITAQQSAVQRQLERRRPVKREPEPAIRRKTRQEIQ